jgi:CRP-like cAMP-binding protein
MDRKEKQIAALPLFRGCRAADVRWIASHADALDVRPGTTLVTEGKAVREFIVIVDGQASADGATLTAGSYFGHLGLIDRLPHDASVETKSQVRALVFSAPVFSSLLDRCPSVARELMRGLVTDLRGADSRVVSGLELRTAW